MPTDAQMAQRKKDLLAAEMAARRAQANATLTNLMTGETVPMPGLLPDPVETIRPQTTESLNRASLETMLNAADRNRRFGVDRTDVPPSLIQGEEWQQQVLADQMADAEAPGTDVDAAQAEQESLQLDLIPQPSPELYPGHRQAAADAGAAGITGLLSGRHGDWIESNKAEIRAFGIEPSHRNQAGQLTGRYSSRDWEELQRRKAGDTGAVTPVDVTRSAAKQTRPLSQASSGVNQISRNKNILRAWSNIFGTTDNSDKYEARALTSLQNRIDQQALKSAVSREWKNEASLLKGLILQGASAKLIGQVSNWDLVPKPGEKVYLHSPDRKNSEHVALDTERGVELINKGWRPKNEFFTEDEPSAAREKFNDYVELWEEAKGRKMNAQEKLAAHEKFILTQQTQASQAPGQLGKSDREKIAQENVLASANLSNFGSLLKDVQKYGAAISGFRARLVEAVGAPIGQFSPRMEDWFSKTFTGVSPREIARINNAFQTAIGPLIETYSGEESGRFSEPERKLALKASALRNVAASPIQLEEVLADLITLAYSKQMRARYLLQGGFAYDLNTPDDEKREEAINKLGNQLVSERGMSTEQASKRLELLQTIQKDIKRTLDFIKSQR